MQINEIVTPQRTETLQTLAGDVRLIISVTQDILTPINDPSVPHPINRVNVQNLLNGLEREQYLYDAGRDLATESTSPQTLVDICGLQTGISSDRPAVNLNRDELQLLGMLKNLRRTAIKMAKLQNSEIPTLGQILSIQDYEVGINDNTGRNITAELAQRMKLSYLDPQIEEICTILDSDLITLRDHIRIQMQVEAVA